MSITSTEIPVDQIKTREGFNPRANVEVDDGFVRSITEHGILQPLEVRPNGDGNYYLVAGERRLSGAIIAGLTEVPVVINDALTDDTPADELAHALIENIQRQDLTPIEEARAIARLKELGYTSIKQLSAKLGLSQKVVKSRLELLALPESLQAEVNAGDLPLKYIDVFTEMANHNVDLADAVWDHVKTQAREASGNLSEEMEYLSDHVQAAVRDNDHLPVYFAGQRYLYLASHFDLTEENKALVAELDEKLPDPIGYHFAEKIDAAESYGCLYRYATDGWVPPLITDHAWASDIVNQAVERNADRYREILAKIESGVSPKEAIQESTPSPEETPESPPSEDRTIHDPGLSDEQQAERKAERERAKADKAKAEAHNQEFAKQLFERVKFDNPDAAVIDALVMLAFDGRPNMGLGGLRYVHPAWQKEGKTETGRPRVEWIERDSDSTKLMAEFLEAPSIEAKLTKAAQLIFASYASDERCVANGRRRAGTPSSRLPGSGKVFRTLFDKCMRKLTPKVREGAQQAWEARSSSMYKDPFADSDMASTVNDYDD